MRRKHSRALLTAGSAGALAAGLAVALVGCASSGRFPSRAELARLRQAPPPARVFAPSNEARLDAWALAGPLPEGPSTVQHAAGNAWEQLLAGAAARRPGLVATSESMHCLAREAGALVLGTGKLPSTQLRGFLAGRCGVTSVAVGIRTRTGDVPAATSDAELLASWRGEAEGLVEELGAGSRDAGLWFGRTEGKAVLVLATGQRRVALQDASTVPGEDGLITLRGELLGGAAGLRAMVNQGRAGFAECPIEEALPRFVVRCPTRRSDEQAWIQVSAFQAGRVLGDLVLEVLARPAGGPVASWRRTASTSTCQRAGLGAGEADGALSLYQLVNQARLEAGLPSATLASEQSRTAAQLAPRYFATVTGNEAPLDADRIALGLLAGWDVGDLVRKGHFYSHVLLGTTDPCELLDELLDSPAGQSALLRPEVGVLSIGTLGSSDPRAIGALVTGYELDGPIDAAAIGQRFLRRLVEERRKRGRAAPAPLQGFSAPLARAVQQVGSDGVAPGEALHGLLANLGGGAFRGWFLSAEDADKVPLPAELVEARSLRIAFQVTRYRPRDEPWSRLVVFVIVDDSNPGLPA